MSEDGHTIDVDGDGVPDESLNTILQRQAKEYLTRRQLAADGHANQREADKGETFRAPFILAEQEIVDEIKKQLATLLKREPLKPEIAAEVEKVTININDQATIDSVLADIKTGKLGRSLVKLWTQRGKHGEFVPIGSKISGKDNSVDVKELIKKRGIFPEGFQEILEREFHEATKKLKEKLSNSSLDPEDKVPDDFCKSLRLNAKGISTVLHKDSTQPAIPIQSALYDGTFVTVLEESLTKLRNSHSHHNQSITDLKSRIAALRSQPTLIPVPNQNPMLPTQYIDNTKQTDTLNTELDKTEKLVAALQKDIDYCECAQAAAEVIYLNAFDASFRPYLQERQRQKTPEAASSSPTFAPNFLQ
jgi:hypothetical protein